uniref:Uncharacterized protein n=1 Tax=Tetranychus urticae TaxID=32264 RepID=T1L5A0_TETUR
MSDNTDKTQYGTIAERFIERLASTFDVIGESNGEYMKIITELIDNVKNIKEQLKTMNDRTVMNERLLHSIHANSQKWVEIQHLLEKANLLESSSIESVKADDTTSAGTIKRKQDKSETASPRKKKAPKSYYRCPVVECGFVHNTEVMEDHVTEYHNMNVIKTSYETVTLTSAEQKTMLKKWIDRELEKEANRKQAKQGDRTLIEKP